MKKFASLLIGLLLCAVAFAQTPATPPAAAKPAVVVPKPDPIVDLTKERDEAKAALANAQAQQQQTSVAAEYYKAVAERNQALLQIVQLQQDLANTQKALTDAQAKLTEFEKKAGDQRVLDSAKAAIDAKKP